MIDNKVVATAAYYLFGDITFPEDFHKKLRTFMVRAYDECHCVVLYKRLESFREFLSRFPELPDIGRREFMVMRGGTLSFTPDYFSRPFEEVFVINFISDKVVETAIRHLFGVPVLTPEFHKNFKDFIMKTYKNSDTIILSRANKKFVEFLKDFPYLPDIQRRKLIIYSSGRMLFTTDYLTSELQKISIPAED